MSLPSEFKFACPVCGQHLQARPEEAGQQTQCPSCFKKLIVPQAPTAAGGKLLISAALADTRRVPAGHESGASHPPPGMAPPDAARSKSTRTLIVGFGLGLLLLLGLLAITGGLGPLGREQPGRGLWTDRGDALRLTDTPVRGRLNGWAFRPTVEVWRDTGLVLRQEGGRPEGLRLEITFPLRGGELVPGKTFRIDETSPPFDTPIVIVWEDERGADHRQTIPAAYVLLVEFDQVSTKTVSGRLHLCLPDSARSWVAGQFVAENRTRAP